MSEMHFCTVSSVLILLGVLLTVENSNCTEVINIDVTKDGNVLLNCSMGNNVTWIGRNGKIVDTDSDQLKIVNQRRLKIYHINSSRTFICETWIHHNTTLSNFSRNVTFNIKIIDIELFTIQEGRSKLLICPGNLINVTWNEETSPRKILNLTATRDNQSVNCNGLVEGKDGQAHVNQTIKLHILYPTDNINLTLIGNSDRLNGPLAIVCQANGNPTPKFFLWYRKKQFLQFLQNNTGTFKISSLQYSDNGEYICSPMSSHKNKSIVVVVKGPPSDLQMLKLIATERSMTTLGISWQPPKSNGNKTVFYHILVLKEKIIVINETNSTGLNYTATGLQSHTKYKFMVRAVNQFGNSRWCSKTDVTIPDNKKPTKLKVELINYTNIVKVTWREPDEEIKDITYHYELCYKESDKNAMFQCFNQSKLTSWMSSSLTAYKEYIFRVRACKNESCSDYTTDYQKKTGPKQPEQPSELNATCIDPKKLNITWKTTKPYDTYHVKHSAIDETVRTRSHQIKCLSLTICTVQVYVEVINKDYNEKIQGMAIKGNFTTVQCRSTSTTVDVNMNGNGQKLVGPLVAIVIFAFVAFIVAAIFIFLYVRPSHDCYQLLRRRASHSGSNLNMENISVVPSSSSARQRLTSFSLSFRKQAICKSDPIPISAFENHVKRMHSDSDYLFSLEYEAVGNKKYMKEKDKAIEITHTEGKKSVNKPKNRYPDIVPYDHSLVVLTELDDDPDSTYINANYIDSYRKERAYIAAQGPLPTTISDFWRMVWENNSRVIVMVTNLFEKSKSKCIKYWPDDSKDYGLIRITMLKEETFANYVVRTFSIQPVAEQTHYILLDGDDESRIIQQFHYTEWPDHDVPIHPAAILRYIHKSKAANPPGAGPIVVHCSAGVGRSGTYIITDSMMQSIDDDKTVDIYNFLNHIRTQRNLLVQEERQYAFVHDALLEYISFGDTNIPMKDFQKHVQALMTVNPDTKRSGYSKEFEEIDLTKITEKHKWAAKKLCNTLKNRRKDILPGERTRVKLPLVLGTDGADYINASYVDGFSEKKKYIATQAPMYTTAECFWTMVWIMKCNILVMLLDEEECKKDNYFADLPTTEEEVTCGKFEIQLESEKHVSDHVTVRKLRLFSTMDSSDGLEITHYHYHQWPSSGCPSDKTSIIAFIENVRNQMAGTETAPITVYCDFGVGRTGIFCLLSTLFDQLEKEQSLDVYQTAKLYRLQRPKLIETEEQYKFCYDILNLLVSTKLESSPGQPAHNNATPDDPDTEPPEKPDIDNSEISNSDEPKKSGNGDLAISRDNEGDVSRQPLLSPNEDEDSPPDVSIRVNETTCSTGDLLL